MLLEHGAEWALVPASADFHWLTGAVARATERPVALALPRQGAPFCLVPRLEADALSGACPWLDLEIWDETDDPFDRLFRRMELNRGPVVLVGEGLKAGLVLRLAAHARCRPASGPLGRLRAIKDREELRRLQLAAGHADQIVEEAADFMRPGFTERDVAAYVMARFEAMGDRDAWVIVASGPSSAHPHHFTSERMIEANDVVLLDLGASTEGYGSDITRTYWLGSPDPEAERVYEVVNRARAAGIAAARTGALAGDVDRAARDVITRAGFGEAFVHRTGHGLGLEIHEQPYLVAGSRERLETDMVHSVEPGIYLHGRFGVRLEDIVVVEPEGARRLNHAPFDPRPPRLRA